MLKYIKRYLIWCVAIISILFAGFVAMFSTDSIRQANAEETTDTLTYQQLFTVTNTYHCTYAEYYGDSAYLSYTVGTSNTPTQNGQQVYNSFADITVFTHGLGGDSSHWGGEGLVDEEVYFNQNSMPYQLARIKDANVYHVYVHTNTEGTEITGLIIEKIDITLEPSNTNYLTTVTSIDFSKHAVVIVDLENSDRANNVVYFQLNYILSSIAYEFKQSHNGYLPKFNLIGHSRGGITNMQYALDHPDMVDNLISIGTPYFGTKSGEAMQSIYTKYNEILQRNGLTTISVNAGLNDIINENLYKSYVNRWNNNYDTLYSNIKFMPMGGTSTVKGLMTALHEYAEDTEDLEFLNKYPNLIDFLAGVYANNQHLREFVNDITSNYIAKKLVDESIGKENIAISGSDYDEYIEHVGGKVQVFLNSMLEDKSEPIDGAWAVFATDILVDLNSQLGRGVLSGDLVEYRIPLSSERYSKLFTAEDVESATLSSTPSMPKVIHNIAQFDQDVIDKVLDKVVIGEAYYVGYDVNNRMTSNASNITYYAARGGQVVNGTVAIAKMYNGKPVTKIADYAFDYTNITTITIPNSITVIGERAFESCLNLQSVTYENGSSLLTIEDKAFYNCNALETLNVPNTVTTIGDMAFYSCKGNGTVTIPASVTSFGDMAYANCTEVTSFVGYSPVAYCFDGMIFSDSTRHEVLQYPSSSSNTTISLPGYTTTIAPYAFAGAENLQTIYMYGVTDVGACAFKDCQALTNVWAGELRTVNTEAFDGTPIMDDTDDVFSISGIGIKYYGKEKIINTSTFQTTYGVATFTARFFENTDVEEIIVDSYDSASFYDNAFWGAMNLKAVKLVYAPAVLETNAFGQNANGVSADCKLYKDWTLSGIVAPSGMTIETLGTNVELYDYDGTYLGEVFIAYNYGGVISNVSSIQNWCEWGSDFTYNASSNWTSLKTEMKLVADSGYYDLQVFKYNDTIYGINGKTNFNFDGTNIWTEDYGFIDLGIEIPEYYQGVGWYTNPYGTGTPVYSNDGGTSTYYYIVQPKEYTLTFYEWNGRAMSWDFSYMLSYTVEDFANYRTDLFNVLRVYTFGNFKYYNEGYTSGDYDKQLSRGITLADFKTYQSLNGDPTNRNIYVV